MLLECLFLGCRKGQHLLGFSKRTKTLRELSKEWGWGVAVSGMERHGTG